MNRNIDASLLLKFIEQLGYCLDILIVPCISTTKDDKHSDGVFVELLLNLTHIEAMSGLSTDWDESIFDLEVPCKLLYSH